MNDFDDAPTVQEEIEKEEARLRFAIAAVREQATTEVARTDAEVLKAVMRRLKGRANPGLVLALIRGEDPK